MFRKLLSVASAALICTNAYVMPATAHHGASSPLLNSLCTFSGSPSEWLDVTVTGEGDEGFAAEVGQVLFESIRHCPDIGKLVQLALSTSSGNSRINQAAIRNITAAECRDMVLNGHTFPTKVAEAIKEHCEGLGVYGINIYGSRTYDCPPVVEQYKPEEERPEYGSPEYYEWLYKQESLEASAPEVDPNLQDYDKTNDYCLSTQETK